MPSLHTLKEAMPGLWSVPPSTEHKEGLHVAGTDEDASRVPHVVRRQGVSVECAAPSRRREVKVAAG